jgi:DNA topoisomerase-3
MAAKKSKATAETGGRTLVIAEKPSVAKDIARVLFKASPTGRDVMENDRYVVSSAIGHLVELCMPEDLAPNLRRWTLDNLPIVPERFSLKAIEKTKERLDLLCKLLNSDGIADVINACDSGREGELIFSYIYELSGSTKPFRRLWLASMTAAAIEKAFQVLRSAGEMVPLQEAARCRSEADWLVGINGTRAITVRRLAGNAVASVGRVQTPTLALVVERDRAIRDFQPVPYWRVLGKFSLAGGACYEGTYQPGGAAGDGRIWQEEEAQRVVDAAAAENWGAVTEKQKRSRQSPPRLYDLTTLQREANGRFGFSAIATLQIAQRLYEVHKAITYPRTDAKALPEDYPPVCAETIRSLEQNYGPLAGTILTTHGVQPGNRKIFNNGEVSDHFAIVPTPQRPSGLKEQEEKIYDMVARRFLAAFYPPAEYAVTTRTTTVAGHGFLSEGRVLAVPGWLVVYERDRQREKDLLPPIGDGDGEPPRAAVVDVHLSAEQTRPPAPYTEATLLTAMETAGKLVADGELAEAMREKGLGTPATRAPTIENLITVQYLRREEHCLRSTARAEQLIDCLNAMGVEILKNPSMTGEWEWKLRRMEQRDFSRADFMAEIAAMTRTMVDRIRGYDGEGDESCRQSDVISPLDGKPLLKNLREYLTADRSTRIPQVIGGRGLGPEEVVALLRDGRIGPFDDFRSRLGRPFRAQIVLHQGRARLEFEDRSAEWQEQARQAIAAATAATVLCPCPLCKGSVHWMEHGIYCENLAQGSCKLRLGRRMLGHELSREEVLALLTSGKSPAIGDFVSNRTKKTFSAHLLLDHAGKITFEFPPRAPKEKGKGKGKGAERNNDAAAPAPIEAPGPNL